MAKAGRNEFDRGALTVALSAGAFQLSNFAFMLPFTVRLPQTLNRYQLTPATPGVEFVDFSRGSVTISFV
jgi:hypothetical protein